MISILRRKVFVAKKMNERYDADFEGWQSLLGVLHVKLQLRKRHVRLFGQLRHPSK